MKKIENMEAHWTSDSQSFKNIDKEGLALVCYVGMPIWFNKFMDFFQRNTLYYLISDISLESKHILDIGTGVGRWVQEFSQYTSHITGVDIEKHRLTETQKKFPQYSFVHTSAEKLPFEDESFDLVNSITVLQHMPYKEKAMAIQEIGRVTKKGGYVTFIELIDTRDKAKHVFPLSMNKWIQAFEEQGFRVKKKIGYEYILILRLLRKLQGIVKGSTVIKKEQGDVKLSPLEWLILRIVIILSYPLEWLSVKILPISTSRHAGILFEKI